MGMVDWDSMARLSHEARAALTPGLSAVVDQHLAHLETVARHAGVDLTDPAQARAALLGVLATKALLGQAPLAPFALPLVGHKVHEAVGMFASFLPEAQS
jgi:hypothetical protein